MHVDNPQPEVGSFEDFQQRTDNAWLQIQRLAACEHVEPALTLRLATTLAASLVGLYKAWTEKGWRGFHHFDDSIEIVGLHSLEGADILNKAARVCRHRLVNAIPHLDQLMPSFIDQGHVEHLTALFERRSILLDIAVTEKQACWLQAEADRLREATGRSKPLKERIIDAITGRPSADQRLLDASDLYRQAVQMTGPRVRAEALRHVLETGISALAGRDTSVRKSSSLHAALCELEKLTGLNPEYRAMQAKLASCRGRIFRSLPDLDAEQDEPVPLSLAR